MSLPLCVHTLLNLPSKDGNYPLMEAVEAVRNNRVDCAVLLLASAAGARIMVPVNYFEYHTVTPTSMLHQIIYCRIIRNMVAMMQVNLNFLVLPLCFGISLRIPRESTA